MPVAALIPRFAPDTPVPETSAGFRCSVCGSKRVDAKPNWAARRALGPITRPSPLDRLRAALEQVRRPWWHR